MRASVVAGARGIQEFESLCFLAHARGEATMGSSVRGRVGGGGGGAGVEALPLPPPPPLAAVSSSPASIQALLARTASGSGVADCQSPRSLLSRILQRGDGGNGGFGFRVRLPRRYSSSGGGGGGREERKDGAEQAALTPRVKIVERAPELPVETPRSSLGKKKPDEELMSMNLGLGASLVLLLSKSAVELNKMVELRAHMEALVSEIRKETTQRKEKDSASSSSQESNGSTTTAVIKDPIACAAAEDALSNCSRTADCAVRDNPLPGRTVVVMDQMEAELQVELNRLQCAAHGEKRITPMQGLELPLLQVKTKSNVSDSPSRSCVDDDVAEGNAEEEVDDDEEEEEYEEPEEDEEEEQGRYDEEKSPPHGGVSARALERRLHELMQRRQQERIMELESALDSAQRRLHEKEREVVWWRDAAKLVSHRRDESRRLR